MDIFQHFQNQLWRTFMTYYILKRHLTDQESHKDQIQLKNK